MKRSAVYKLLVAGDLVYVGSSTAPKTRLQAHRSRRPELRSATMEIVCWYPSVGEARVAEQEMIERLRPVYNGTYNPSRGELRRSDAYKRIVAEYAEAFCAEGADRPRVNAIYERKLIGLLPNPRS